MPVCAVAFTHTAACRIFTIFTSVSWHRVVLASVRSRKISQKGSGQLLSLGAF